MNVVDLNLRVRELQQQNQRLRHSLNTNRNSQSHRGTTIDFQSKYKKALKQIYDVIQANKQLKEQLDKLKTSRNKLDASMADVRKQEIYKVYQVVLNQKNILKEQTQNLENDKERYLAQINALQAEVNILKGEKMYLVQQKEALEAKSFQTHQPGSKGQELQQLQIRIRQKEQQFHRTLENYEQHHITLSNQSKKSQERVNELQQKLIQTDKNWRNRFEAKQIQFKEIKTNARHEFQDQINSLRKEINSLKLLNNDLMTKLQTVEMDGRDHQDMTQYEIALLNSIKQLRLQMEPLRRQIVELQEQNSFQKQQAERERTQLQLKVYEYQSNIQHYSIQIKNQEQRILKLNETIKKHTDNESIVKKLQEQNRILGGRVIVLESKELATEKRRQGGSRKLQENVLEFQTRVQMLLNEKENLSNLKNVSIHQLVTLKAYIVEMDQKLKNAYQENEYATKKYKSYKEKYLSTVKQIKNHEVLQNTLKSKIMGYDKLVQRLQSELEKNVNLSEMQVIEMNSKTSQEMVQIQNFKKKYQSLKEKLILQEKYNKQELETVKLNYETKIVDLSIKVQELNNLRQSVNLYKEKNGELMALLSQKQNEILEVRLSVGKQSSMKSDNELSYQTQNRQLVSSLQQTINRQQSHIFKLQTEARTQQQTNRKRILALERQLHEINSEYNKIKLVSTTKFKSQNNTQQLSAQNKRLKNKISQLENELILNKGRNTEENSKNSYELEFRISNLQIEKNQLINKLQTQTSHKKRLQKQYNELVTKTNELDAELTQTNLQNNRKFMEVKYELNEKQSTIQNLQQQLKRLKIQRRNSFEVPNLTNSSVLPQKQDHSACENKIKRLQRELENSQADNEQLRRKANEGNYNSNSFNYELESLKHEKEEARLKIQRLEKEINASRNTLKSLEDEKYEVNRVINSLKAELSSIKLAHQDEIFEKDRVITQLRSRLEHSQSNSENLSRAQSQLQQTLQEKQRESLSLRSRLLSAQADIQKLNQTVNQYNKQITAIKYSNESSHSAYTQQMEQLLEEKTRTIRKYEEEINRFHSEIEMRDQQISVKTQALMRVQRQVNEYREAEQEIRRLKSSLNDRQSLLNKNKFELSTYQDENQRAKREISQLKEQIQRVKLESIQKDDEISSMRLEISTLGNRVSNQIKNQFMEQIGEKQSQLSRLNFQIQSLQNSYNNVQEELSQIETKERKAQQELILTKNQLRRTQEELNEINERLMKRQSQINLMNGEMTGLKFLEEEVNQKNSIINKLKSEITSIRIQITHLGEQIQFKQSTIIRQNNELKLARQQLMNREEQASRNDSDLRNVMIEVQRLRSALDENEMNIQQKDMNINRLTADLNKVRQQYRDLEQEIQEREQEWSNIQFELNQAKNQILLVSDQLEGKDIAITKLSNQSAFLKQQITRLNEQLVEKNQEINRISQQVFVQKMQYTNRTSEQVQTLSNEIFGLKRQLESAKHSIEDLQGENRRLKIQLEGSRIKLNEQHSIYLYTEEDMSQLKEDNNRKYREIMQLQFEISQHTSQNDIFRQRAQTYQNEINSKNQEISLLEEKAQKLQSLLKQLEEQHYYNNENLQSQIQQFVQTQRKLRYQIEHMESNQYNGQNSENSQELKFGLKLYTEQTDRLKLVNEQLVEQVNALRLKLNEFQNQEDRIQQNLITMVLSFAEIQSLRERVKNKQIQIKEVRKSFIQAISSGSDVQSQNFKSSKLVSMVNQNHDQNIKNNEEVASQNSASLLNYKSEMGVNQGHEVKEINQYEVRSQEGNTQLSYQKHSQNHAQTHSLDGVNQNYEKTQHIDRHNQYYNNLQYEQEGIGLPQPRQRDQFLEAHETSHHLAELNELRESDLDERVPSQTDEITFRNNQITPQQSVTVLTQNQVTLINPPQQTEVSNRQHQRASTVNITYQANSSQVQTASSYNGNQQRISSSQFQAPSGVPYVRITSGQPRASIQQGSIQTPPGVYIPQGMNIAPIRQPIPVAQSISQTGNMIIVGGQVHQQGHQIVTGSFPQNPQNLRY